MKKRNVIIISVAGVLVVLLALHFLRGKSTQNSLRLDTTTMSENKISTTVTATGTVDPITEVTVGTQVSGIISKIYVDYNSVVKKGEVLAELDKTNLLAEYNSQLETVQSSKDQLDFQKKNYDRSKELHDKNLISDIDYETALYNYQTAESAYNVNLMNLKKAKTNLGYATITSPIDGVVLQRAVEQGQTVAASFSTPTLFDIAQDLTKMQVVADVDEADIGNVRPGQRVDFSVDAYPDDTFHGNVTQVRLKPTVSSNVVTYEVVINAPNKELKLKPGLTATVTIYTTEKNHVETLPNKVFNFKPDYQKLKTAGYSVEHHQGTGKFDLQENERYIWKLSGKTLSRIKVQVGDADNINTEVVSGLTNADSVVADMKTPEEIQMSEGSSQRSPFLPNFHHGSSGQKSQGK